MSLFEKAARKKYRFWSSRGALTVEDLWDMPLQAKNGFDLDNTAKTINRELKDVAEESFVDTNSNPAKAELEDKLSIVVHVINTKKAENEAARTAAARRAEKDQLLEILHSKKNQEMLGLSTEELEARIKALEA